MEKIKKIQISGQMLYVRENKRPEKSSWLQGLKKQTHHCLCEKWRLNNEMWLREQLCDLLTSLSEGYTPKDANEIVLNFCVFSSNALCFRRGKRYL
jgi:hypothetical protein